MKTKNKNDRSKQIQKNEFTIEDYVAVLNSISDAVFMYDFGDGGLPGKFVLVNDAATELTEYSKDELMGLTPMDISSSYGVDDFRSFGAELHKTGTFTKEVEIATRTGQRIPTEIKARRIDIQGKMLGLNVVRDITNRLRLHETEDTYRNLFEHIHDVIYSIDADFHVATVSPSIEQFLGYTPDEFIGKYVYDCQYIFQPAYRERAVHTMARLLSGEIMPANVYGLITKDGREVFAEIQGIPYFRDGKVAGAISVARDITERMHTEKALQESEEKYRNLFKNSAEGIYQVNPEGHFINANPACARVLGYDSPEELIGTITDISSEVYVYPEDRDKALAMLRNDGFFKDFEIRNRRKDGSIVWVSASVHVVKDNKGNVLYHEGTSRDITERKEAEIELRESEERFRLLHEASFGGIGVNDKGVIMEVNRALCEMTGYDYAELIGMDGMKLIAPECYDFVKRNILSQYEKPYEAIGLKKDGSRYPLEIQGKMIPHMGKRIRVTEFRDITARKEAERALRESEERYRHLMNHVPVGIVEVDVTNDKLIDVNDIMSVYTEYSKDELLAMKLSSVFTEESRKLMNQRIRAFGRGEDVSTDVEYEIRTKSGKHIWVLSHMRHVVENKKLTRTTGIIYDISKRKLLEEMVKGRLRELESELTKKKRELKDMNLDLLAKKGALDRIQGEYEMIRQQVVENKNALATLAKNVEQIHYETQYQVMTDLKKVQLPVLERMRNDRRLENYKGEIDFLINQLSQQSSTNADRIRVIHLLTPAELQIATQIGRGMSSEEISAYLNISVNTVKTHRKKIRSKLGLQDSKINLAAFLKSQLS